MALQGTLDTFELPDVLRLLESTSKSGRLRVNGSSTDGSLWVDDGMIIASYSSSQVADGDHVGVLFELLRLHDGQFLFVAEDKPEEIKSPVTVGDLVTQAERHLEEWREIEEIVPSTDAWVRLVPELSSSTVTLEAESWRLVVAIGPGTTVASLGAHLGLSQVPVSRMVKDLVEKKLAEVDLDPPDLPELHHVVRASTTVGTEEDTSFTSVHGGASGAAALRAIIAGSTADGEDDADPFQGDPDDLMTQEEVESAAEEAGVDPDELGELGDGEINRASLLKFLSSVRS